VLARSALFLLDVAIAIHALAKFFLGIICHARLYIRKQIRKPDIAKTSVDSYGKTGAGDRVENYVQLSYGDILKSYTKFACTSLLAFAIALYICSKILFTHLANLLILIKKELCRNFFLYTRTKIFANDLVEQVAYLKANLPSNKKFPQNVTIIVPSISIPINYRSFVITLNSLLKFLTLLGIRSVSIYMPFAKDLKLIKEATNVVKHCLNVNCIFSVKESQYLLLEALDSARSGRTDQKVSPNDVTKVLSGVHADMILVFGGYPSFYGYVPWHTRLSEAFFLPSLNRLVIDDVVGAFVSYLSIEQRFGK